MGGHPSRPRMENHGVQTVQRRIGRSDDRPERLSVCRLHSKVSRPLSGTTTHCGAHGNRPVPVPRFRPCQNTRGDRRSRPFGGVEHARARCPRPRSASKVPPDSRGGESSSMWTKTFHSLLRRLRRGPFARREGCAVDRSCGTRHAGVEQNPRPPYGRAHTKEWADAAQEEMDVNPRYVWFGEVPHWQIRRVLSTSRLMVVSSLIEGGPNCLSEAIVAGLPVLATHIDGCVGVLGPDCPRFFPVRDLSGLRKLLCRAEEDEQLLSELERYVAGIAPRLRLSTRVIGGLRFYRTLEPQ